MVDDSQYSELQRQVEAVLASYQTQFAGQPRISREVGHLEALIERLEFLGGAIRGHETSHGGPVTELLTKIADTIGHYREECDAIREARAAGPIVLEAHHLETWAGFVYRRYRRHFAGKSRSTRDLGLLAECIDGLRKLGEEVGALHDEEPTEVLAALKGTLAENLDLYLCERGEIVEARGAGPEKVQADVLAEVANAQFALYKAHFSKKPRLSRRPALLQRIIDNLEQVGDRMSTLDEGGYHSDTNRKNIKVVASRVGFYKSELEAIREQRKQTDFDGLVAALGGAANDVFSEYRDQFAAQDRQNRDIELLGRLCDELYEIALQMEELDRVREHPNNIHNLSVVVDTLRIYEKEYELVRAALAEPTS